MEADLASRQCAFCLKAPNPDYGKFFTKEESNISVHQYCLFFASGLPQNGNDNEGFDGFLIEDILKELRRGQRLKCSFCKEKGATIGCSISTCKIRYHYPCGIENGTLEQFCGRFDAFCEEHKPVQKIPSSTKKKITCAICFDKDAGDGMENSFLKGPCCVGSCFHRSCLQKYALSSGYFFRCPTCNNAEEFLSEMKIHGIYIPDRDALWEDGVHFADLLEVDSHCDSSHCYCPNGRSHEKKSGHWELLRCHVCGHSAIHRRCGVSLQRHLSPYTCDICLSVENKAKFEDLIDKQTKECAVLLTDCRRVPRSGGGLANEIRPSVQPIAGERLEVPDNNNNNSDNNKLEHEMNTRVGTKAVTTKSKRAKQRKESGKGCPRTRPVMCESNGVDFSKNGFDLPAKARRSTLKRYSNKKLNFSRSLFVTKNCRESGYSRCQCEALKENYSTDTQRLNCALHIYLERRLPLV